jgi:hypothetical protein
MGSDTLIVPDGLSSEHFFSIGGVSIHCALIAMDASRPRGDVVWSIGIGTTVSEHRIGRQIVVL